MNRFIRNVIGLSATLALLVGSGVIFIAVVAAAATIHWAFLAAIVLVPIWMAAMLAVMDSVA